MKLTVPNKKTVNSMCKSKEVNKSQSMLSYFQEKQKPSRSK